MSFCWTNFADCYLRRQCWLLLAPHNNWFWFAPSNEIRQAEMMGIASQQPGQDQPKKWLAGLYQPHYVQFSWFYRHLWTGIVFAHWVDSSKRWNNAENLTLPYKSFHVNWSWTFEHHIRIWHAYHIFHIRIYYIDFTHKHQMEQCDRHITSDCDVQRTRPNV